MCRNFGQAIPILPIGLMNEFGRLPVPLKQRIQRQMMNLGLLVGNIPNHAIELMGFDERLGSQIDLPRQLLPFSCRMHSESFGCGVSMRR